MAAGLAVTLSFNGGGPGNDDYIHVPEDEAYRLMIFEGTTSTGNIYKSLKN